jgi:uncharacterized protein YjdB
VGALSDTTTLTVTPAVLEALDVEPLDPSIAKGTTLPFTATGLFSDGTSQDLTTQVAWTSSSPSIATINASGIASALAVGTTTITATKSGITDTSDLTVTAAALSSIAVTPPNPSIAKGTTKAFTATGTYSDGSTQDITNQVLWGSSSIAVATVSNASGSQGTATGTGIGATTISATLGGKIGKTTLTVTAAVLVSIAITPSAPHVAKGYRLQLVATGTFSDGTTQNLTTQATWTSSTRSVATVSNAAGSRGVVTVRAAGTSTMSATFGGKTGTTVLTGTNATLVSIAVTPATSTIAIGAKLKLTATGTFSDGTALDISGAVSWRSNKKKTATVNAGGVVTGKRAGTATITATHAGKSGTASVTVS